ncbi:hypothetical protein [Nonomuraea sp. SBT364]|uniref:hypothetical protein n=1 Tax=Nonomuraea sp. SBT364 TaxID=1580530 RepID=UPI0012E1E508|nr:hypothetical protein [Nonomuraea sp. SBT364]
MITMPTIRVVVMEEVGETCVFRERERATAAKLLPGLDESPRAIPLMELEGPGGPGIRLFLESGGPGCTTDCSWVLDRRTRHQ